MITLLRQLKLNMNQGPHYVGSISAPVENFPPVRVVAFYLPQFHPIPENDLWWGPGFTEWTNVTRALPQFDGHYQPRLPADLGFYDLRSSGVLHQQAELAKKHGVYGFCFHYYWFSGRKILESPLQTLLSHPEINLPFCLNWANENWTRTWDGMEAEILLAQTYEPGFEEAFISAIEPALRDPRYIRISGRPLLMVYRPRLLPNAGETVRRWRTLFAERGLGEPFLAMVQFGRSGQADWDPRLYGFDAAVEFPPHKVGRIRPTSIPMARFDLEFKGGIRSYEEMVRFACMQDPQPYRIFRGVCPGFDNTPRRPNAGTVFIGSTPQLYGKWLRHACEEAQHEPEPDARLVFVNAWNEWGEGAYLEPDRHFGHAYLVETARTLQRLAAHASQQSGGHSAKDNMSVRWYGNFWRPVCQSIARLKVKTLETVRGIGNRLARDCPPSVR